MRRVFDRLERWLPLLACLSGVVVPVSEVIRDGAASDPNTVPDLDEQLGEILDLIALQEQSWRPKPRPVANEDYGNSALNPLPPDDQDLADGRFMRVIEHCTLHNTRLRPPRLKLVATGENDRGIVGPDLQNPIVSYRRG